MAVGHQCHIWLRRNNPGKFIVQNQNIIEIWQTTKFQLFNVDFIELFEIDQTNIFFEN